MATSFTWCYNLFELGAFRMYLLHRFLSIFALNLDPITGHIIFSPFGVPSYTERMQHNCVCSDFFSQVH
jgi:hypothetical protein